jgi:hypothetical protein
MLPKSPFGPVDPVPPANPVAPVVPEPVAPRRPIGPVDPVDPTAVSLLKNVPKAPMLVYYVTLVLESATGSSIALVSVFNGGKLLIVLILFD